MAATVRLCLCAGPSLKFSSLSHRCRIWVCGSTGRYVYDVAHPYRDAWFGWNAELGEKQKDRKMKKNYLAKINRHRPALRIDQRSLQRFCALTQLGAPDEILRFCRAPHVDDRLERQRPKHKVTF